MIDALKVSLGGAQLENFRIEEKALKENEFLEVEHRVPLLDRPLCELGEVCRGAHFCMGYHAIICTLRVCLVCPRMKVFYFPPVRSAIIDAFVEQLENDSILLSIAVQAGIYFSTIQLRTAPKVCSSLFFPLKNCPSKIYYIKSTCSVLCCYDDGGVEMLSLRMSKTELTILSVNHKGSKRTWLNKLADRFHSRNYRSSFFDKRSGSLLILYDGLVDFFRENDEKVFEHVESVKCSSKCVSIVASSNSHFIAYLVHSSGDLTPVSLVYTQNRLYRLLLHDLKDVPLPLSLRSISDGAAGEDTVVLYNNKSQYIAILCEKCQSLRCLGEVNNLLTIYRVECPISAIFLGNGRSTFFLYHTNGTISLVKRLSSGEMLYYQLSKAPYQGSLFSNQPSKFSVFGLLEAVDCGLSFSAIRSAWNDIMIPYESPQKCEPTLTAWNLSHGAKGCAQYFAHFLRNLHVLYSSPYASEIQEEILNTEQKIFSMYFKLQENFSQERWTHSIKNISAGQLKWNEHLQLLSHTSFPFPIETAIAAQAEFLRNLMHFVFRSLGYTLLLRVLKKTVPNFPRRCYEIRQFSGIDWMEFICRSDLEDWEDACCLQILQIFISTPEGKIPNNHQMVNGPFSQEKEVTEAATLDPLYHELKEVAPYLSKKSQAAIHLYSLLYKREYDTAFNYSQENCPFLLQSGLWNLAISLLEEHSPVQFAAIKLLAEEQWSYANSSIWQGSPTLDSRENGLTMLFERLEELDQGDALLLALQYVVKRFLSNEENDEKSSKKLKEDETGHLHIPLHRKAHPVSKTTSHISILSAICNWMEKHPPDDWRIPVFETVVKDTKAFWRFYVKPTDVLQTYSQCSTANSVFIRHAQKTCDYDPTYLFFRSAVLAMDGGSEAIHEAALGFYELARFNSISLRLSFRLEMVKRCISLCSSQLPLHPMSSPIPQSFPSGSSFSSLLGVLKQLEYHLLLQEQLEDCLEKHLQKHLDGTFPSYHSEREYPYEKHDSIAHASTTFSCDSTCPALKSEDDREVLKNLFVEESDLHAMAVEYRSIGGASIELDLLKIHPDAGEEAVEEAMSHLLSFLHDSIGPAVDAEGLVSSLLQDSFLLEHFYAPFPWHTLIGFILFNETGPANLSSNTEATLRSQRSTKADSSASCNPPPSLRNSKLPLSTNEMSLIRAVNLFLESPVPPLSLFFFLYRILWDRLNDEGAAGGQETARTMEFQEDAVAKGEVATDKKTAKDTCKTWHQWTTSPVSPESICSLPTVLPLPDTSNSTVAPRTASIQEVCWKYLVPLSDITSALRLVLSHISSEEDRAHCEAQLQIFPAELFEE